MAKAPLEAVVRHIRKIADAQMLAEATDGQLVDRFVCDHEELAFAALLRRHGPMVLSVCCGVLGHREDAEDVFQATFLLLARKARSIRKRESVASWLHGVAYRLAVRAKEQRALRRSHETKASTMRRTGPRVEEAWEELRPVLQEEMEKLPEKYRTALLLYYWEGKTQPEVARELGCPIGTVQSRLGRGRKLLQERLTRRGFTLSAGSFTAFLVAGTTIAPDAGQDAGSDPESVSSICYGEVNRGTGVGACGCPGGGRTPSHALYQTEGRNRAVVGRGSGGGCRRPGPPSVSGRASGA